MVKHTLHGPIDIATKREGLKNMDLSILWSEPPTHPNMENNKKTCCFFGFLAHLEKNLKSFFTLPPTIAINCCHSSPPPTTDSPRCYHPPICLPPWWLDAGGGWNQWSLAVNE